MDGWMDGWMGEWVGWWADAFVLNLSCFATVHVDSFIFISFVY
jgi:hypothetical protein